MASQDSFSHGSNNPGPTGSNNPEDTTSKTIRKASPGLIGIPALLIAFSANNSIAWILSYRSLIHSYTAEQKHLKYIKLLTQQESEFKAGTRWHRSRKIRITMTQLCNAVALA